MAGTLRHSGQSSRINAQNNNSNNNYVNSGYTNNYSSNGSTFANNSLNTQIGVNQVENDPLFTRQASSNDEFQELIHCRAARDNLQQEVSKLQKINLDLEALLERQAKQSLSVETECINIDRTWAERCTKLEREIHEMKGIFEAEKMKGDRVREQLSRTERELYGIFQRKYQMMKGPGGGTAAAGPGMTTTAGAHASGNKQQHTGPSQYFPGSSLFQGSGGKSSDQSGLLFKWEGDASYESNKLKETRKTRERKVVANLTDFLGF